ncbi:MAG: hypothetical protein COA71_06725 [SAR86 cluster bacterium]|uniref:Zinc finger/thioredoxin putative domain-containing protein n=1 Tax=SAR86 cluster bacterium TaxID=2030880 RepID=A0A2A5CD79_9GAMM|nr:DUF3426 domain-containing protein [Gammaproteobacteria bacterium AH-315-E17]PCJ41703.1 MAG: hypothetical protein COA71_06725 [SAR86 cluster bacterium]
MSSFITQCPHCETSFNITQAQLKLAKGKVRCGFCLQTFSALEQQLFIEEELEPNEPESEESNNNLEHEQDNPKELLEENETLIDQTDETLQYEKALTSISWSELEDRIEEESLYSDNLSESGDDTEAVEQDLQTDGDIDNTEETINKELIEDVNNATFLENTGNFYAANVEKNSEEESEEDKVENTVEEIIEEQAEEVIEQKAEEKIENQVKENPRDKEPPETDRPTTSDEGEPSKKKEELQNLGALYDDEALNTDGDNPVNALSEEPISIYRQKSRPVLFTFLLFFSNILLILGLASQYTWANIDTYLRDSRFASLTGFICTYANCPAIERFDLSLFSTDQLLVNTHPSIPNALQIDFIFRNTAEFEQAFPLVELSFSDLNRRLVVNRLFKPGEYLEQELQQFTHLPPNSSIQIRLEISDPGTAAINYSLTLRTP